MKIEENSSLSLNDLKGALLIDEHGAEFRIHDFYVDLDNVSEVCVAIKSIDNEDNLNNELTGLVFSSLKKWTIQFTRGF
nr:hypothetical protein [uncultured Mediterranean phage uvMED]